MHSAAKLIIGILIFIAGLYWYIPSNGLDALLHLKDVFVGVFGIALIILGLIIAWIEYEDLKWERKDKRKKKK